MSKIKKPETRWKLWCAKMPVETIALAKRLAARIPGGTTASFVRGLIHEAAGLLPAAGGRKAAAPAKPKPAKKKAAPKGGQKKKRRVLPTTAC